MDNPLLQRNAIPVDYTLITLDNMRAAFDHVLQAHERGIERIIAAQQVLPTWDDLVLAVDELDAQLLGVLYGASPLLGRGQDWAEAIVDFFDRAATRFDHKFIDAELQALYARLAESAIGQQLDAQKRATLHWHLNKFSSSGVLLEPSDRARLVDIQAQIRSASVAFSENINRPGLSLTEVSRLDGIP